MSIFSKSRGTTIRPRHYYDEKIVFVLGLFTILLPGFYQSPEATGKYFNALMFLFLFGELNFVELLFRFVRPL